MIDPEEYEPDALPNFDPLFDPMFDIDEDDNRL